MPKMKYATSTFIRERGNLPELRVVNMYVEEAPTEDSVVLQSRPGLVETGIEMGAGPVKELYQVDGVLDGDLFGVSADGLYKGGNLLGAMDGSGPAAIDGFENRIFATQGASLYQYDGTTFSTIATPGDFEVLSLCVGTSRLIVIDKDSGQFYWSDVLSDNIDTLSFATAEYAPDKLKECLFVGDSLHLFGSETVEFWPASTANPLLPYQPLVGRTYLVGIRDTGCAAKFATTFAWITNHNQVCVGDPTTVISDTGLEERLINSTSAALWSFWMEGTEFLAVTLDTETWVFSRRSSQWSLFESNGQTNWIPRCYGQEVFGSSIDGRIVRWGDDHQDFDDVMERSFHAGIPITTGILPVYSLELKSNPGRTPFLSGDYMEPEVEIRTSNDGGVTWGKWRQRKLGVAGKYRTSVRWTSLGFFGKPGLLVEVRITDPTPFRVSDLVVNDDLTDYGN